MNVENLIENIESILECAQAIKNDAENNPPEGSDLYDKLREGGYSIHFRQIVEALEFYDAAYDASVPKDEVSAAFDIYKEWRDTGLCNNYGDLYGVKEELDLFHECVCELSTASGLHAGVVRSSFSDAIKQIKGQGVSSAEKALLTAVKTFIAATKE
tara:strand:- start:7 stop:477 length:471 start_codon:yes stop_codon:yes gene_type:complete